MKKSLIYIYIMVCFITLAVAASLFLRNDSAKVETLSYQDYFTVENIYPHHEDDFTEGLFFYKNQLFESTGIYGKSKIRKNINLSDDKAQQEYLINSDIFGEGAVVFKNKLYMLTYKENKVLVFDPDTLKPKYTLPYSGEGWGLTTDGKYLIAGDGSENIYFMDENLKDIRHISVKKNGKPLLSINELEYIDGYIWANVWHQNELYVINPKNGKLEMIIDCSGLVPDGMSTENVLNGIAYNKGKFYITGKNWNIGYELKRSKKYSAWGSDF